MGLGVVGSSGGGTNAGASLAGEDAAADGMTTVVFLLLMPRLGVERVKLFSDRRLCEIELESPTEDRLTATDARTARDADDADDDAEDAQILLRQEEAAPHRTRTARIVDIISTFLFLHYLPLFLFPLILKYVSQLQIELISSTNCLAPKTEHNKS